jgi:hypothetical protein
MRAGSLANRQMVDLLALDAADGAARAGRLQDSRKPAAAALPDFACLRCLSLAATGLDALTTDEMNARPPAPCLAEPTYYICQTDVITSAMGPPKCVLASGGVVQMEPHLVCGSLSLLCRQFVDDAVVACLDVGFVDRQQRHRGGPRRVCGRQCAARVSSETCCVHLLAVQNLTAACH